MFCKNRRCFISYEMSVRNISVDDRTVAAEQPLRRFMVKLYLRLEKRVESSPFSILFLIFRRLSENQSRTPPCFPVISSYLVNVYDTAIVSITRTMGTRIVLYGRCRRFFLTCREF